MWHLFVFLCRLTAVVNAFELAGYASEKQNATTAIGQDPQMPVLNSSAGITPLTMAEDGQSYYVVLKTGNISFRVALDSGSSDLWIYSSACETTSCRSQPRYPLAYESPTFVSVNDNATTFSATYADGTAVSGFVAAEEVFMANLTATNQTFGVITTSNVSLTDAMSGLLGLGFPRLSSISHSVANSTPFFASLARQGLLDYPLFGLSLNRGVNGSLTLGAIDSSIVTNVDNITWNKVVEFAPFGAESNTSSYLEWAIPLAGIAVNGSVVKPSPTYGNVTNGSSIALLDIGTPGLFGPYQDVSRIYDLIEDARLVDLSGQWAVPCDTSVTMSFTFGKQEFALEPSDYLIGPAAGNPSLCLSWPRATQPNTVGIDWQIGTAFLRTVYSIFSFGIDGKEPPMIGFYPLHNATTVTESPDAVQSIFSSLSATIATTLPNFPLSTPTYSTPPYALNSSIRAPTGGVVSSGLATSTYVAILTGSSPNLSAIPLVTPPPTYQTVITTDSRGELTTFTSAIPTTSILLGVPPGWNADSRTISAPSIMIFALTLVASFVISLDFSSH